MRTKTLTTKQMQNLKNSKIMRSGEYQLQHFKNHTINGKGRAWNKKQRKLNKVKNTEIYT
jgi:hypothetical protein